MQRERKGEPQNAALRGICPPWMGVLKGFSPIPGARREWDFHRAAHLHHPGILHRCGHRQFLVPGHPPQLQRGRMRGMASQKTASHDPSISHNPCFFPGHADCPQCHPCGSGRATGRAASASQLHRGDPRNSLDRSRISTGMLILHPAAGSVPSLRKHPKPQGESTPLLWEWGGDPKPPWVVGTGGRVPQILPPFQTTSWSLCSWLPLKSDTEDVGMGSCLHRS